MPKIERWDNFPTNVRQHLAERMLDRSISVEDLNNLRLWMETQQEVPDSVWFKDFGTFKICGHGSLPKTFLLTGQSAKGKAL
jgi:hypothetical protein